HGRIGQSRGPLHVLIALSHQGFGRSVHYSQRLRGGRPCVIERRRKGIEREVGGAFGVFAHRRFERVQNNTAGRVGPRGGSAPPPRRPAWPRCVQSHPHPP